MIEEVQRFLYLLSTFNKYQSNPNSSRNNIVVSRVIDGSNTIFKIC